MKQINNEKGQALIIIAIAAVVLMGFTALAIDGARVFEDKRHAQNAADTAALAGALAYSRQVTSTDAGIEAAAQTRATENGYVDQNSTTDDVTVTITTISGNVCPANLVGREIQVDILSTIDTTFGRILGRDTMTTKSTAIARACGTYSGPPFGGNAIVSLSPSGRAYDGTGTPDWVITGGGIYSNSTDADAAYCNGAADITVPSVTTAGGTLFNCAGVNIGDGDDITTGASQYSYESASAFLPREPECDGAAYQSGGVWYPQSGADGSNITWNGASMDFAPGLYCVTNSPGPYNNTISGSEVTFFITNPNFSMTFNGGGSLVATAPSSGEYKGILIFMKPNVDSNGNLINSQSFDLRGNGANSLRGAIIAPSASITLFGNSDGGAIQSQVIGYNVDSGGTADIYIQYDPSMNYQTTVPYTLSLLE